MNTENIKSYSLLILANQKNLFPETKTWWL